MTDVSPQILATAASAAEVAANAGQHHPELAMSDFKIGKPLAVQDAHSVPHYIAVPVLRGLAIFGYFTCNLTGEVTKFTSFCSELSDIDACPLSTVWLNPRSIVETASEFFPELTNVNEMFLSFDDNPDRLAWRLIGQDADGKPMTIFVAGLTAFAAS